MLCTILLIKFIKNVRNFLVYFNVFNVSQQ